MGTSSFDAIATLFGKTDKIYVIKDGGVVEQGKQLDLLEKQGYYHNFLGKKNLI